MGEMMSGRMGQMMNGGMMDAAWTWGSLAWFGLLALTVMISIGIVVGLVVSRRPGGPVDEDPREMLRRRFARGELSADEFAAATKMLG